MNELCLSISSTLSVKKNPQNICHTSPCLLTNGLLKKTTSIVALSLGVHPSPQITKLWGVHTSNKKNKNTLRLCHSPALYLANALHIGGPNYLCHHWKVIFYQRLCPCLGRDVSIQHVSIQHVIHVYHWGRQTWTSWAYWLLVPF